ncbi:MAG: hypothetical protein IPM06_18740 [Rhizobiales bacterium]|nr:hypothetical protein [Hyphomicrobiales bacterium]
MSNLLNTAKSAIIAQDNEFPVGCVVVVDRTGTAVAVVAATKDGTPIIQGEDGISAPVAAHHLRHATNEELKIAGIEKIQLSQDAQIKKGDFWALTEKPGRLRLVGDAVGKFPTDFPKSVFFRFCPLV